MIYVLFYIGGRGRRVWNKQFITCPCTHCCNRVEDAALRWWFTRWKKIHLITHCCSVFHYIIIIVCVVWVFHVLPFIIFKWSMTNDDYIKKASVSGSSYYFILFKYTCNVHAPDRPLSIWYGFDMSAGPRWSMVWKDIGWRWCAKNPLSWCRRRYAFFSVTMYYGKWIWPLCNIILWLKHTI